jgi:hypothetical protein
MKPTINVSLLPDGSIEIDAVNFKGSACTKATEFLEKSLGMDTAKRKKKPEWSANETVSQVQRA